MTTINDASFKVKACKTEDVTKLPLSPGAIVYDKADGKLYFCDAVGWREIGFTPPKLDSVLCWLDGTLSGEEFVDRSGNGRNFTIANRDFTTTYFPYKSAATISAPVGDAVLFAADVNSFLYGADADTPNEIPVVSFFQNIDYEDKLFTRHVDQVVDGNGVETTEPHVKDIVLYDAALTGDDLTTANTYYGVPTSAANYWVAKDGSDSDAGTEAEPFLTLNYAESQGSDGVEIYAKTGQYDEGAELINAFQLTWLALGRVGIVASGNQIINITSGLSYFHRLYLQNNVHAMYVNANLVDVYNCYFDSQTAYAIRFIKNTNTVKNSVFKLASPVDYGVHSRGDAVIESNLFSGSCDEYAIFLDDALATEDKVEILRNTFKVTPGKGEPILIAFIGQIDIIGNTFANNLMGLLSFSTGIYTGTINFNYNIITNTFSSNVVRIAPPAGTYDVNMIGNDFNVISSATGSATISVNGQIDVTVQNNILAVSGNNYGIIEQLCTGDILISNNRVYITDLAEAQPGVLWNASPSATSTINEKNALIADDDTFFAHSIIHVTIVPDVITKYNFCKHTSSAGGQLGITYKGEDTANTIGACFGNILKNCKLLVKAQHDVLFYNNTIYNGHIHIINNSEGGDYHSDDNVFKNNIVLLGDPTNGYCVEIADAGESGNVFDYNIYYSTAENPFYKNGTEYTFTEWQALGYDTNSVFLTETQFNNLFTDVANYDFSLATGSAAIGAGETLDAAYDDGLDASTDWGDASTVPSVVTKQQTAPWDIGAYVS